jgi:hypothetical protein
MNNNANGSLQAICTTGFTVIRNGTRFATTAGHCQTGGWWVTNGSNDYIGSSSGTWTPGDIDARLIANYGSFVSTIWFGSTTTTAKRNVTDYEGLPALGTPFRTSGGNSGITWGSVDNRYSDCAATGPGVLYHFMYVADYGTTTGGDSGSPVSMSVQGSTTDVIALGIHHGSDGDDGGTTGCYTRIDQLQLATNSTIVLTN